MYANHLLCLAVKEIIDETLHLIRVCLVTAIVRQERKEMDYGLELHKRNCLCAICCKYTIPMSFFSEEVLGGTFEAYG